MINIKTVGMFFNKNKSDLAKVAADVVEWFLDSGFEVIMPEDVGHILNMPHLIRRSKEINSTIDLGVSLGGDGTLLNIARRLAPHDIPILGINMGHLGFLTEVELKDLYADLNCLKSGEYFIDTRMMIEARVTRDGTAFKKFLALNDIVITKGPFARLLRLRAAANGKYIDTYPADGLIISTPTGSTAYSLSAGGPIINPNIDLILITPICPHTLQSRSIVISAGDVVEVEVLAQYPEAMLTVDGQQGFEITNRDKIAVRRSRFYTKLVRLKTWSFYDVLRMKLTESTSQE